MAELIAGQEHGDTLRQQQGGDEVALLLPAQGIDGGIVGRTLHTAVPAVVVVAAVLIVLTIGVIVFVVVTDQVVEREAIVTGDEIDAGIGLPPIALVQV